jgi:hypothetical protein
MIERHIRIAMMKFMIAMSFIPTMIKAAKMGVTPSSYRGTW